MFLNFFKNNLMRSQTFWQTNPKEQSYEKPDMWQTNPIMIPASKEVVEDE